MGEQGSFDPALFGFEEAAPRRGAGRVTRPTGCYVKLSEGKGRSRCRLTLDARTARSVHESFGGRVAVSTDKRGALMLHEGSSYKVSGPSGRTGTRSVSIDGLARDLTALLGGYGNHWYEVAWDDERMVILRPVA